MNFGWFTAPMIWLAALSLPAQPEPRWKQHDLSRPLPPIVEPGTVSTPAQPGRPPSDAIVLFDGKDLSQWSAMDGGPAPWVVRDGAMESVKGAGYLRTLRNFGDCQLHVEWAAPAKVEGEGQARGNSGVFLMTKYEVQVLDSYQNPTYADGCAASVYGQYPPLVNACRPPGQWQTYDIVFLRPRFDRQGRLVSPARLTVFHNGVLAQNQVELTGPTDWMNRPAYQAHPDKLPLALQDHGNPVRFRNLWVRELAPDAGPAEHTYSAKILERLTGLYEVRPDFTIAVDLKDGQLQARIKIPRREAVHPLFAESPVKFFMKDVDAWLKFSGEETAPAQTVTLRIGIEDLVGTRK